jgi:zinc/manganese transport system ATP-binding protein
VVAALHDLEQVRREFPDALLMARELVAWGPSREVLSDAHLARARTLAANWADPAAVCER